MATRAAKLILAMASVSDILMGGVTVANAQEGVGKKPAASEEKRAYADALVLGLEVYQRETRIHKNANPASRWVPFPGHGYRLSPREGGDVFLVAQPTQNGRGTTFAVAVDSGENGCRPDMEELEKEVTVVGWSKNFKGHCIDDVIMYRPLRSNDVEAFRRLIEKASSLIVTAHGHRASFDLSSVSVVEAKVALDALGPPPE